MAELKVVHTVAGLAEWAGGPSRSVVALVDHLATQSHLQVHLITQRVNGEEIVEPAEGAGFHVVSQRSPVMAKLGRAFAAKLDELLQESPVDIVHAHGIWNAVSFWSGRMAKRRGKLFVLHPRGMLEPWCLEHKALKKKVAMTLYQRRQLESVDMFVATAEQELESIRALGLKQPVAVIPNGVALPDLDYSTGKETKNDRQALFLSRIHPVKGLTNLVRAWAGVNPKGWRLMIAGPNEGGHWSEVDKEIRRLGISDQVNYVGPVEGEAKARLYRESDLFILPSFSENFGIVVAEALSYGLPVITTTGTPWAELKERGCGWWVHPSDEALQGALREALSRSGDELHAMGSSSRQYAAEFGWPRIAEQTAASYRWLLGKGSRPDFIHL